MTIQAPQSTIRRARIRCALCSAVRSVIEPLEPRVLLSGNLFYVNDNWHIVTDVGTAGLSAGDTVDNSSDDGSLHGLTFGTNAFNTLSGALAVAGQGDTVVFVSGSYSAAFGATINSGVSLQGWGAFAATYALPATNPDPSHLTQSALNSALAANLTGAQFTLADSAADAISVSGFKFAGYPNSGAIVFASSNHAIATITGNTFSGGSNATAIVVNAGTALINSNTFSGNGTGVVIHAGNATISGNHIILPANGNGVIVAGGNAIAIIGNTIGALSGLGLTGIAVSDNGGLFGGVNGSINAIVSGNVISSASVGIGLDGQGADAALAAISGNTLTGDSTAVLLQGNSASATIVANVIIDATTGIDAQGGAGAITGNSISGSTTGVLFEDAIAGGPASGTLTANRFDAGVPNDTDLDIAAAPTLVFGGGNHFAASSFFINNESPDSYTLTQESFGTRDPTIVADKIVDQTDDDTLGKINYNLQLTIDSFTPNLSIVPTGGTLTIQGTYTDGINQLPELIHIDWGDGTVTGTQPVSGGTFTLSHQYNFSGSFVITTYMISGDVATSALARFSPYVVDMPALAATILPTAVNEGGTVTLAGNVSEPGNHSYALNINWGDSAQGVFLGSGGFNFSGISWNPATGAFSVAHIYPSSVLNGGTSVTFATTAYVIDNNNNTSNVVASPITISIPHPSAIIMFGSATPAAISVNATGASVYEATTVTLDGSYTDPNETTPDTFNWHVTSSNGQVIADATTQNFSFTPVQNGSAGSAAFYSAVFTVTDPNTDAIVSTPFVLTVVDKPPVINLSASATTSTVGATYTLAMGAITDPGTLDVISGYKINWGDGTIEDDSGAGPPPPTDTHVYAVASANYTVSVTLIDNDGTHPNAGSVNVMVNATVSAAITFGSATPAAISVNATAASVYEATAVTLDGSYIDPNMTTPDTFNWHVTANNGQVIADATTQNFSFTPVQNGSAGSAAFYSAVFTVTDAITGSTASLPFVVTVVDKPPVIDLSASATTSIVGATYILDMGKITDPGTLDVISGYKINWGDGTSEDDSGAGPPPATDTHVYSVASANYAVSVTLIDNDGTHPNAGSVNVMVNATVSAAITFGSATPAAISVNATAASVYEATAVTLDGTYIDPNQITPDTFNWHVTSSNGQVIADATTQNFSFTSVQNGSAGSAAFYSAVFTVTDAITGSTASSPFVLTVVDKPPVIDLSASATTSTVGATYTLAMGKITDPGTLDVISGYQINWGDGTIEDDSGAGRPPATETHVYTVASANYAVSVTLIDNDGTHPDAGSANVKVNAVVSATGSVMDRQIFYADSSF